jgi:hypothetical protein
MAIGKIKELKPQPQKTIRERLEQIGFEPQESWQIVCDELLNRLEILELKVNSLEHEKNG